MCDGIIKFKHAPRILSAAYLFSFHRPNNRNRRERIFEVNTYFVRMDFHARADCAASKATHCCWQNCSMKMPEMQVWNECRLFHKHEFFDWLRIPATALSSTLFTLAWPCYCMLVDVTSVVGRRPYNNYSSYNNTNNTIWLYTSILRSGRHCDAPHKPGSKTRSSYYPRSWCWQYWRRQCFKWRKLQVGTFNFEADSYMKTR